MRNSKPKIVIDTNVLLVSIAPQSSYHWLYQSILKNEIDVYVTNEMLTEYMEIIAKKLSETTANFVLRTLLELENVHPTVVYFHTNFIINDPDDNKFVDCAFACGADFLISNDKHFKILKTVEFPVIPIVTFQEFEAVYKA